MEGKGGRIATHEGRDEGMRKLEKDVRKANKRESENEESHEG